jgi:hypothetical protein
MKTRNLLIASFLLAALAGLVFWAQKHPSTPSTDTNTPPAPKLADIPDSSIQQVEITRKDTPPVTLEREAGKWVITTPQKLPADQDTVSTLLTNLSPVNGDSVVEEKASNLAQYGLATPSLTVKVQEKNGKTDELKFGNDVVTGSLTYATVGSGPKVYAVSTNTKTSLDKTVNDLRDKRLLTFDSNKLTSVEVNSSKGAIQFAKNNQGDWQIVKPQPYRADNSQVGDLVRMLGEAKMDVSGSADDLKKAETNFSSGTPVGTVKVTDASGTQTLDVRKNKDDYYARGTAVTGAYKVNSDLGNQVAKTLDDYRNKKLFDFAFSDPTKIVVQQNGSTATYVKSGTDYKANGQTQDPGKVQSLIDKLRELSASKFSTSAFPGASITLSVTSNDGKRVETVELAKSGDIYLAIRENEPAVYEINSGTVDDILKANSEIKPAKKGK